MIIVIGVAMVAFLLGDILSSGGSVFSRDTSVGEIAGREIDVREFEQRVDVEIAKYQEQQGRPADESTRNMIRERVWNNMMRDFVLGDQLEELGISVSDEELYDMFAGNDPHPMVIQSFTNQQTGQFDRQAVVNTLRRLDELEPQARLQWNEFQNALYEERKVTKYNTLIKQGLYVTYYEAKENYLQNNDKYKIKYVAKRYDELTDSAVTVSDNEIKAYYNDHLYEYEEEESRTVQLVQFDVVPSVNDWKAAKKEVDEVYAEYQDIKSDSVYLAGNFPNQYAIEYYTKDKLVFPGDSVLFDSAVGATIGPFLEDETYRIVKLLQKKTMPDSVKARHILIDTKQMSIEGARAKADSLKKLLEEGADFAELAQANSADQGSAAKGGDLGYFSYEMMVPPFANACFEGKVGDMPVAESKFGVHLIEILDQQGSNEQILTATINMAVEPSNKTYEAAFKKATDFSLNNTTAEAFKKAATEEKLQLKEAILKPGDRNVLNIESSRGLVKWAYSVEEGKVSEAQQYGKAFVVACLTDAREDGPAPLEKVREDVMAEVVKQKKAEKFIESLGGAADINNVAQVWSKPVEEASDVIFASYAIPGVGSEPKVIGTVPTLQKGQMSQPLIGNSGVFVVQLEEKYPSEVPQDLSEVKLQVQGQMESSIDFAVFEALKEMAGVKDERHKFY